MTKVFNSFEEIKKYYDEKSNTYIFKENDEMIDLVKFKFDLDVEANIDAWDIDAWNICAINIEALDINYFAVCFAYDNIKCKSIKGRRDNAKHFILDGMMEIEDE